MMFAFVLLMPLLTAFGDDHFVKVEARKLTARQGNDASVTVVVRVSDGYHIQAAELTNDLIPTTVKMDEFAGVNFLPAEFPPGKKFRLEGTDDFLDVYGGRFKVRVPLKVESLSPGKYVLNGELGYQACDSKRCFFPRTIRFRVDLVVI